MLEGIAGGLAMKMLVSFETNIAEEIHDSMKVVSDDNNFMIVNIHAVPPQARIVFEPFVNMGFVKIGKEKLESVCFKNEGKTGGRVNIKYNNFPEIEIDPTNFFLKPNEKRNISIQYRLIYVFIGIILKQIH